MTTLQPKSAEKIILGDREVGESAPVLILAEIGGNFRTLEEALQEVRLAAECGVDGVKIQTYRAETLVAKPARFTKIAGGVNQYDLFKQYEVSEKWHHEIFSLAKEKNLIAFSTPSYYEDVDLLMKLGVPALKIGSDDLTNLPFLEYAALTQKPLFLSTGMAELAEVREAVETILAAGNKHLVLLHCVSQYPVKERADLNLRSIPKMRDEFGLPVGFSDHSEGILAGTLAAAAGACVIEKHFTIRKSLPTPDSFFSADPQEMKSLVQEIRKTEKALGVFEKNPTLQELDHRLEIRKSLVAKRPIAKGETLTPENLIIKRPGTGISPKDFSKALGRKALSDIGEDEMISWEKIV